MTGLVVRETNRATTVVEGSDGPAPTDSYLLVSMAMTLFIFILFYL